MVKQRSSKSVIAGSTPAIGVTRLMQMALRRADLQPASFVRVGSVRGARRPVGFGKSPIKLSALSRSLTPYNDLYSAPCSEAVTGNIGGVGRSSDSGWSRPQTGR